MTDVRRQYLGRQCAAIVLAVLVLATGCGTQREDPDSTAKPKPSPSSSAAPTPSATATETPPALASGAPHALADLVKQPCRALSLEDIRQLVVVDGYGQEISTGDGGKQCSWMAQGGRVTFMPDTSTDQTTLPQFRHLTRRQISGHRTLVGTEKSTGACVMIVAVGTNQSFRVRVSPLGADHLRESVCNVATNFTKAILSHLR